MELSPDGSSQSRTFGKYRLIASLGQGGMANVYLAVIAGPAGFNKLLVVKALREDVLTDSEEFVHMFLDEARLSARLNHPNIVQTYEIGESDGRYFIAMEYLEGQPLRVAQRKLGSTGLPLEEELRIIAETGRGLHYAHELRGFNGESLEVVHRDVSPQNVFLTYDGQVKLLDFGIAKARDAEHLTKVGVIKGKLDYIAPEQIRGDAIDRRADVFALGAMTWECVTGQRFAGGSKIQDVTKLHRRLTGCEPKIRELKPDVPDRLVYIVERALALDPGDRYPTTAAFADDIESFLDQMGMRPSAKTLSERLAAPFKAERAKINALIDEQIKLAQQDAANGLALPSLGRSDLNFSGVRTGMNLAGASTATPSGGIPAGRADTVSAAPSTTLAHTLHSRRRLSTAKIAAIAGVLAAAAVLGLVTSDNGAVSAATSGNAGPARATNELTGATASKPDPVPAPAPALVRVHVEATPSHARATLDGTPLPGLPFRAQLPKDDVMHYVEVTADGYANEKIIVPFDRDRDVSVALQRVGFVPRPKRRPGAPAEGQAHPSAAPANEPAAPQQQDIEPGALITSKRRVRAEIDTTDPYAN